MVRWTDIASTEPVLRLPHPYHTPYCLVSSGKDVAARRLYRIQQVSSSPAGLSHEDLASKHFAFTEPQDPKSSERPDDSNNSPPARARRAPHVIALLGSENDTSVPTLGQFWLVVYLIFTLRPGAECFRLTIEGEKSNLLKEQLQAVSLAVRHASESVNDDLVILRSTFWQGAGSPFGPRPPWLPDGRSHDMTNPISSYPANTLDYVLTDEPGVSLRWHPRRPAKPLPGSVIYSRYIPHLRENFSMVALDYQNSEHLNLFHQWQNDPRVSQGWNGTGTLDQHREYLRKAHEDPHQITVLARFDNTFFAYFDIYWAKEDRLGAFYNAGDFDRGRHSLVGDVHFRGPHRVSAWWSSLVHYLFLDDPRTMAVVGEVKFTNSTVLSYDLIHGFGIDKFVDLPDKRSGLMRCSRERFFQLCPLADNERVMGGTGVGLLPKL